MGVSAAASDLRAVGEFRSWGSHTALPEGTPYQAGDLDAPAPRPSQIFAVGLNYRDHADEAGLAYPTEPLVFGKFASSIAGAEATVTLPPGGNTDWQVELVAVIGTRAENVTEEAAWQHVAGLAVGQDLPERITQLSGPAPQFGLGKSFPGFTPFGPILVTPDELDDPDDLAIECSINGETVQSGRTRLMIFNVPQLIQKLSAILPLLPGDIIFTGTPAGVGTGFDPPRFLQPGDELVSAVEGIGTIRQTFVAANEPAEGSVSEPVTAAR